MTEAEILAIAKRTKCQCHNCHSTTRKLDGSPVFDNEIYGCKIGPDGNVYCNSCARMLNITPVVIPEWVEPDRISDMEAKRAALSSYDEGDKFECYIAGRHSKRRCMIEEGGAIFVFDFRRKKYGERFYDKEAFLSKYDLVERKKEKSSEEEQWKKRIERALSCLFKSGLWPELVQYLLLLDKMTLEDKKDIYRIYMNEEYDKRFTSPDYDKYVQKYPFMFKCNGGKIMDINTNFIYEMSDVHLKSMYFGKGRNETYKKHILSALQEKKKWSISAKANYDVSFDYDPEQNKAWYSEEYRGCGNGHYYVAISESTAWFCEND